MNKRDYTGKVIFVGIDVHKKTYFVTVVFDNQIVKRDTLPASPDRLVNYLKKNFMNAKIKSAYEAGFSGFALHRTLQENGIENIVVNASSIEVCANDRVKTDKRDSLKIATQLAAGRLRCIFIPSKELEDCRELTRYRDSLIKDRTRIAAKLKQKANYHSLIGINDSQKVCKAWIDKILKKSMMDNLRFVFEDLVSQWKYLSLKIEKVNKLLEEQAIEDEEKESVYRSVKGIGSTVARVLANELDDMKQFSSERALFRYTGLTPSEYSSGEHVKKGHITRQGKPILRKLLVQASWVAIRYDRNLKETFERIALRAGRKRAIIAIARRLIGRLRACFQTGSMYQRQPV